ncbi:MAG: insulinase family protein [Clostridia bacterium]|nr:insulinase family protein [Clostridia bacterium]
MYNVKKFSNGLTLIHSSIPAVKSVAIGVFVKVGSSAESDNTNGIAHYIEHMLFKGTKKRTAYQLVSEIEDIGAVINASTSKEITNYYTSSLSEHTEACMDILSDIFFNSTFPIEEMEKEKEVVLEEIAMCNDTPDDLCMEIAASAFFSDNAYGRTILGPAENIKRFCAQDLRDFMDKFYTPDATVVSVAGEIDYEYCVSLVDKYFAQPFSEKYQHPINIAENNPTKRFVYKEKDVEQANLSLAFPSFPYESEFETAIPIMNIILGSSMSSRLFQKVREEKGFAYSIYSYPCTYLKDGYFLIYFGSAKEKVRDALITIKKELDEFLLSGVTDKELARAKEQLKSSYVMGQESTQSVMRMAGRSYLLRGSVRSLDEQLNLIQKVTKEDVLEVSKRIFNYDKMTLSYVGKEVDEDLLNIFLKG